MSGELAKTALHAWHAGHGGRMVDFAGWSMPVQYGSIVDEHLACRTNAALFDVSHMGRLSFSGTGAEKLLDRLLTRKVAGMPVGRVRYSLMCNEAGGILDDVLVYHLLPHEGPAYFMLVVNASNRQKIVDWIGKHLPDDVELFDHTERSAMIAVQGPKAVGLLSSYVGLSLESLGYYTAAVTAFDSVPAVISRTGYTGEDGCEIIVANEAAEEIWGRLAAQGARPAGLAARDTLRLEAAMPLYGHELSESIDPYQAGLDFAVNLPNREFIGREALVAAKGKTDRPVRVGLVLSGRRVPREHYTVHHADDRVGEVTSGTFSPTLGRPIAMAYVEPHVASPGTALTIDIRGTRETCEVAPLPFYKRAVQTPDSLPTH